MTVGREWPPDPLRPDTAKKKPPPESWFVVFLLPGAPLIAVILVMAFGSQWWLACPIGWLTALIITTISVYARQRNTT